MVNQKVSVFIPDWPDADVVYPDRSTEEGKKAYFKLRDTIYVGDIPSSVSDGNRGAVEGGLDSISASAPPKKKNQKIYLKKKSPLGNIYR